MHKMQTFVALKFAVINPTQFSQQVVYSTTMSLTLADQPEQQRYAAIQNGTVVAHAEYRDTTNARMFTHTEVSENLEGQGVASALIRFALEDVKQKGWYAVPMCPFVVAFIERHRAEFLELVQPLQRRVFGL
jgi:uncharacterized protein